jgi:hypothetical protein
MYVVLLSALYDLFTALWASRISTEKSVEYRINSKQHMLAFSALSLLMLSVLPSPLYSL